MLNKRIFPVALSLLLLWSACDNEPHFITDTQYLSTVRQDFAAKQQALPEGDLFAVFETPMTTAEREAMMFLYAYMPMGDVTDYDGDFYLRNVRTTFQIAKEMPWGDRIPEDIFRHYLLPLRVNNENLDDSRKLFYDELKERVSDLSLYDAVLEVNHWCHEKVIYNPTDARTMSPGASLLTAYGRCGEESVFTVAALRAVGIPARQVYTPRWAHTDDNHAWVEAWVDGQWYFMGACEPEPVLNLGWFNEPASRGMLMHTKVFGKYEGPEEIMETTDVYTEINVIDIYAPTAQATITVVDSDGNPQPAAEVEFKIYNYGEFYTVARKRTDEKGEVSLSAGIGDMLVWATYQGVFGSEKVSFGKQEQVKVVLNNRPGDVTDFEVDIVPPVAGAKPVAVTSEQKSENARRLKEEDRIRNAYVATFYTEEKANDLAIELQIDAETTRRYLIESRGNWREIEQFLRTTPAEKRAMALELLGLISTKDLRDTPAHVLTDHLMHTPYSDDPLFAPFVLKPRIANELLTPYRDYLQTQFTDAFAAQAVANPEELVAWVKNNIQVNDALNPQHIPMTPIGVCKAKRADAASRNLFFVAAARSLGIPARIEPIARAIQYNIDGAWVNVNFDTVAESQPAQGKLMVTYTPIKGLEDPRYSTHFTIARLLPSGKLQTLNLQSNLDVDMGGGALYSTIFSKPIALDAGHYLLVTGMRMADGSLLSKVSSFDISSEETTTVELRLRQNREEISVIGSFEAENKFRLAQSGEMVSLLQTAGRGYYVVGILGAREEPTNHAMRDIAAVKQELEAWGRGMILLFPDEAGYAAFDKTEFGALPATIVYGIDADNAIQKAIVEAMKLTNPSSLPIFIIADSFNRVVFVSQGYTIGLGEQLMQVIHKL